MDREATVKERSRVLLIEDDAGTRNMISRHLGRGGYAVTAVESAEEGMVEAGESSFDVVVSDVHLPGLSGIELAGYLLSRDGTLPIVLVTGDPDEALAREALSRGPVSYLLKPFELFELDVAVRRAIGRREGSWLNGGAGSMEAGQGEGGRIPDEWLALVEEKSYAGRGHATRVTRMGLLLRESVPALANEITVTELQQAARTHEVGRLGGLSADPTAIAVQGAEMLAQAGLSQAVVKAVRHLYERWDGTGGPEGLTGARMPAGAQLLSAADALDHYCSAWLQAGLRAEDAAERAINLVTVQQGLMFSPVVVSAVQRERAGIREICMGQRPVAQPPGSMIPTGATAVIRPS
jgi:response regulator RpfG family c-di-GMP phosphodiesterase